MLRNRTVVETLLQTRFATPKQLEDSGITDDEAAWKLLDSANDKALQDFLALTGKDKKVFLAAFTKGAVALSNRYGYGSWQLNWFDCALAFCTLGILGLVGLFTWHMSYDQGERRLVASHDLPAYVDLNPTDVAIESGHPGEGGFGSFREMNSRYPLTEIKKGAELTEANLSGHVWNAVSPGEATLLTVPVRGGWDFSGWKMPLQAVLIASPRAPSKASDRATELRVLIVGIIKEKAGTTLLVSTAGDDATRVDAFRAAMGTSEIYVQLALK